MIQCTNSHNKKCKNVKKKKKKNKKQKQSLRGKKKSKKCRFMGGSTSSGRGETYALPPSAPPLLLAFPSSSISSLPSSASGSPISSSSSSTPWRMLLIVSPHRRSRLDQWPGLLSDSDFDWSQKKWRWDEDVNLRTKTRPVVQAVYGVKVTSWGKMIRSSSAWGWVAERRLQQK